MLAHLVSEMETGFSIVPNKLRVPQIHFYLLKTVNNFGYVRLTFSLMVHGICRRIHDMSPLYTLGLQWWCLNEWKGLKTLLIVWISLVSVAKIKCLHRPLVFLSFKPKKQLSAIGFAEKQLLYLPAMLLSNVENRLLIYKHLGFQTKLIILNSSTEFLPGV